MYKGKAIYNPAGKAGEYAKWACNLYVGCSNNCDYCYCKKGVLGTAMGGKKARLKACFRDETHAFEVFVSELRKNADAIRKEGGLFFSFSTDPCLPETIELTLMCVAFASGMNVPCQFLTKCTDWIVKPGVIGALASVKEKVAIGFTLTGMDAMEKGPTVASNRQRVDMMKTLHVKGFKTFASIEPVVDIDRATLVFGLSEGYCDFYKIGLMSGKDDYDNARLEEFVLMVNRHLRDANVPVYWKESVRRRLPEELFREFPCVEADLDIFANNTKKL